MMKVIESLKQRVKKETAITAITFMGALALPAGIAGYWGIYLPAKDKQAREQLTQAKRDITKAALADEFNVTKPVENPWDLSMQSGRGGTLWSVGDNILKHPRTSLDLGQCTVQVRLNTDLNQQGQISAIDSYSITNRDSTVLTFANRQELYSELGSRPCASLFNSAEGVLEVSRQ